ncbi:TonB-dependent receptor [uncultured Croceitalea sp.]|uniref:SusC/RagA family TonB-linked outer membrane protein n=1 Tax=uncultured Croceitalea sp. TaxID=1798908 RepID=UPI0033058A7B
MRKQNYRLLLVLLMSIFWMQAQEKTITGTVTDQNNVPLPGVNVVVKETIRGTQTDFDGNYTILASEGEVLVFSYLGQTTAERTVGASNTISLQMQEDAAQLEEVIVVGYGTQSKRTLTDNVVKLTSEDIKEVQNPNFQNALVGKAAGVQITQTNGKVEGGINIRVRGAASISGDSQPLYVVDGIPLSDPLSDNAVFTPGLANPTGNGAPTNPLLTLSANEIESIDILKDASSAAIYGARGANGVVIITTKKGKQGKATFSLNLAQGFSRPTNRREYLNAAEYIELFTEAARNSAAFDTPDEGQTFIENRFDRYAGDTDWRTGQVDTDWQDESFQDGYQTDADFSVSGADAKTSYFFSGAYTNSTGIVRGNELEKAAARINLSHQLTDKFKAGMNLSYSRSEIDRISNDNAFSTPLQAIAQTPLAVPRLPDGTPNNSTQYGNFLFDLDNAFFKTIIRRLTGKAFGEYKFTDYLKINSDFAYDFFSQTEEDYDGLNALFQSTSGQSQATDIYAENYIFSNYLTFDKTFSDKHNVNVVVGTEYNNINRRIGSVTSILFPSDAIPVVSRGAEVTAGTGIRRRSTFLSYFARATYAFDNKYLFKASVRRDGSSRFGKNVRFGTFPSVSAGWILSEEDFLKESKTLSFLKLRASWGQLGNAEIGDYPSRYLFSSFSYNKQGGLAPLQPGNDELTWEKSSQVDIGLEFGLFDGVVSGEIDYYNKETDNLLFALPLPRSGGAATVNTNAGTLVNKGVEVVLNTRNISTENFTWNTSFNISRNDNEITALGNNNADVITGRNILRVGENLNSFYMIEYAGVDSANGDALYFLNTENPDGTLNKATTNNPNEAQRVVVGNPYPEWLGGLTNTINFKNVDFTFTFQGQWGASIFNDAGRFESANGDFYDNQTRDQLNRWQNPGDITDVPQARLFEGNGTARSTRYLDSADFIRLRNISLGYTIPGKALESTGLSKVRIYVSGLNLLTFTSFDAGWDPESTVDFNGPAQPGIAFYSAPPAKTVTLGLNINF